MQCWTQWICHQLLNTSKVESRLIISKVPNYVIINLEQCNKCYTYVTMCCDGTRDFHSVKHDPNPLILSGFSQDPTPCTCRPPGGGFTSFLQNTSTNKKARTQ